MISEVKTNNEQIFAEKAHALKEKEEMATCSQNLEAEITQACNMLPELHIPEDAESTTNIQKLAATVRESKDEIGRVRFELQLQISELQCIDKTRELTE